MRSYGDKPKWFTDKVPSGLLPAFGIVDGDGNERIYTESKVLMDIIEIMYPPEDGYLDMDGFKNSEDLVKLERELFSSWCNLVFRPPSRNAAPSWVESVSEGIFMKGKGGGRDGGENNQIVDVRVTRFIDDLTRVSEALDKSGIRLLLFTFFFIHSHFLKYGLTKERKKKHTHTHKKKYTHKHTPLSLSQPHQTPHGSTPPPTPPPSISSTYPTSSE